MAGIVLMVSDLAVSLMWVWAGALVKLLVYGLLGFGANQAEGEILKISLSVLYMFVFAWICNFTRGAYNPLTVLSAAFSGSFHGFLFIAFGRIPAQVIGSIIGVKLITKTFPGLGRGPRLNVDIHHGALIEGLLTFMIVMVSMGLKKKDPKSFFMKTWISSISKVSLHILGSDLTGGVMNPASAFGWAYARGDHITAEHLFVYWLAPIQATVLGVWAFRLITDPGRMKGQQAPEKAKKTE